MKKNSLFLLINKMVIKMFASPDENEVKKIKNQSGENKRIKFTTQWMEEKKEKENAKKIYVEKFRIKDIFVRCAAICLAKIINDAKEIFIYKKGIADSLDKNNVYKFFYHHQVVTFLSEHLSCLNQQHEKMMQIIYHYFVSEKPINRQSENITVEGKLFFGLRITIDDCIYKESFIDTSMKFFDMKNKIENVEKIPFFNDEFSSFLVDNIYEKIIRENCHPVFGKVIGNDDILVFFLEKIPTMNYAKVEKNRIAKMNPLSVLMRNIQIETEDDPDQAKDALKKYFIHSMVIYLITNIKNFHQEKIVSSIMNEDTIKQKKRSIKPSLFELQLTEPCQGKNAIIMSAGASSDGLLSNRTLERKTHSSSSKQQSLSPKFANLISSDSPLISSTSPITTSSKSGSAKTTFSLPLTGINKDKNMLFVSGSQSDRSLSPARRHSHEKNQSSRSRQSSSPKK